MLLTRRLLRFATLTLFVAIACISITATTANADSAGTLARYPIEQTDGLAASTLLRGSDDKLWFAANIDQGGLYPAGYVASAATDGTVTATTPIFDKGVQELKATGDGRFWFLTGNGTDVESRLNRVAPGSNFEPIGSAPTNPAYIFRLMAATAGSAFYFSDSGVVLIGSVTSSGAFSESSDGFTPGRFFVGGAVDSLGRPWIGEVWDDAGTLKNAVAIVPAGGGPAAEHELVTSGPLVPDAMLADDGGGMWISLHEDLGGSNGLIGHVDSSGNFTPSTGLTADRVVEQLFKGPGGTVWFVEIWHDEISDVTRSALGTIDVDGGIHELDPLPANQQLDSKPIVGPDGNLWTLSHVCSCGGDLHPMLTRITPAGEMTSFDVALPDPTHYGTSPVVGADNRLWFLENWTTGFDGHSKLDALTIPTWPAPPSAPLPNPSVPPKPSAFFGSSKVKHGKRVTVKLTHVDPGSRVKIVWTLKKRKYTATSISTKTGYVTFFAPKKKGKFKVVVSSDGVKLAQATFRVT